MSQSAAASSHRRPPPPPAGVRRPAVVGRSISRPAVPPRSAPGPTPDPDRGHLPDQRGRTRHGPGQQQPSASLCWMRGRGPRTGAGPHGTGRGEQPRAVRRTAAQWNWAPSTTTSASRCMTGREATRCSCWNWYVSCATTVDAAGCGRMLDDVRRPGLDPAAHPRGGRDRPAPGPAGPRPADTAGRRAPSRASGSRPRSWPRSPAGCAGGVPGTGRRTGWRRRPGPVAPR
jgi:hypothetical protein